MIKFDIDLSGIVSVYNKIDNNFKDPNSELYKELLNLASYYAKDIGSLLRTLVHSRSGNLLRAVETSYKVIKDTKGWSILLGIPEDLDSKIGRNTSKWTGRTYPSYWRLLKDGWGRRGGTRRDLYPFIAIMAGGKITSPYNPVITYISSKTWRKRSKGLTETGEPVLIYRHPGRAGIDWYSLWASNNRSSVEKKLFDTINKILIKAIRESKSSRGTRGNPYKGIF